MYIVKSNNLYYSWFDTWVINALQVGGVLIIILIWEDYSIAFDEMMQVVVIKKWFSSLLPVKKIFYPNIKAVVLKRYAYEDEDGDITNEGYFHLELSNGDSCLLMKFTDIDSIENARKKLARHTQFKIQSF